MSSALLPFLLNFFFLFVFVRTTEPVSYIHTNNTHPHQPRPGLTQLGLPFVHTSIEEGVGGGKDVTPPSLLLGYT